MFPLDHSHPAAAVLTRLRTQHGGIALFRDMSGPRAQSRTHAQRGMRAHTHRDIVIIHRAGLLLRARNSVCQHNSACQHDARPRSRSLTCALRQTDAAASAAERRLFAEPRELTLRERCAALPARRGAGCCSSSSSAASAAARGPSSSTRPPARPPLPCGGCAERTGGSVLRERERRSGCCGCGGGGAGEWAGICH